MPRIDVVPVEGSRMLRRFVRFPRSLYPPSSLWVSHLDWERARFFDPRRNPFFSFAAVRSFLAVDRNGRDVGRIAAIDNPRFVEFQGRKLGFFGFFDAPDDEEVSGALFEAAEAWLRARGLPAVQGPVNPSTNHECGLLVSGFDRPPRIQLTYNDPHYGRLVESAGYRGVKDLVAYEYEVDGRIPERLLRARDVFAKRHSFTLRKIDLKKFDEEIERVKLIYNDAWSSNYGFVPLSEAEIGWLAKELRPVIAPDLCAIAEVAGEPAAFMILLPDLNQAIRPLRGKLFPLGWWTLLRGLKRVDAMRALAMGVRPKFRKTGLDYAFYAAGLAAAHGRGYKHIELSWILADNLELTRALGRLEARETKRYRLYEKALA
jgi:GNAT superfamily N-acetyltransferase